MTKAETIKLMAVLRAAYPNQSITEDTVEIYATMLEDVAFEDAKRAVKTLIGESRFFPTIAEIRTAIVQDFDDLPAMELAWGEVMSEVKRVGYYGTPQWSSEVLMRAVRAVGWEHICLCEVDQLNTLRAQFLRTYGAYRDATLRRRNLDSLHGEESVRRALPTGTEGGNPRHIGEIVPIRRQQGGE